MKNPERVREGEEAGGIKGQPGAGTVVRGQREKIQNGLTWDKRFEDEDRAGVQHYQRWARLFSGGIHVGRVRGESHSVTSGDTTGEQLQETLNLERESCEHLRWTHLEQIQHSNDLPRQVTFPAHTEQGKIGPGFG